jgi:hypothetical protein
LIFLTLLSVNFKGKPRCNMLFRTSLVTKRIVLQLLIRPAYANLVDQSPSNTPIVTQSLEVVMNSVLRSFATVALGSLLSVGSVYAADSPVPNVTSGQSALILAAATYPNGSARNNTPDNGAIRRANPNSRQGTQSISPQVNRPATGVNPRPPTLENGGIRNGYPTRQQTPAPSGSSQRGNTR